MINKLIKDTLKPLGIPVDFHKRKEKATTYITFFEYLQQGESFSDDDEETTGHYIQVDVWSKVNYNSIVTQVKELLGNVGFRRKSEYDLYEEETSVYHKVLRFFYVENLT
ncbi:hypothetical protein [Wukongibacter sp. M2B1]|uniref:hypothetical protein n=1 Tax=Wukongibacter sp. M2B1 TaxID=3088895 RepID=UPI003D7B3940